MLQHWNVPYIECLLCRLIRRPEHLIGRHWHLPANWRSFIRWSPDQWVSQCYAIECYRNFYCALFCIFMTRVSECPMSLRSEHTVYIQIFGYSSSILFLTHQITFMVNLCLAFRKIIKKLKQFVRYVAQSRMGNTLWLPLHWLVP
jgi:hypothetical protein